MSDKLTSKSKGQEELIFVDENCMCLHCGLDPYIFWGRDICNHYHYPEDCAICQMLANHRKYARNNAISVLIEKEKQ